MKVISKCNRMKATSRQLHEGDTTTEHQMKSTQ
jgi:hypothetical protein